MAHGPARSRNIVAQCAEASAIYIRYQHLRGDLRDHRFVISSALRDSVRASGHGLLKKVAERGRVGLFTKTRSIVGLDIGSSAVKAVELKPVGKGFRVAAFGSA